MPVRRATPLDLPLLADVERRAAERFPHHVLPPGVREGSLAPALLARALEERLLWVATDDGDDVVGFLAARATEDGLHVIELDVLPGSGGRGLGSWLLAVVVTEARARGCGAVTLTTFEGIPWNAPFYARRGFRVVPRAACSGALSAALDEDDRAGLQGRVAMVLKLG